MVRTCPVSQVSGALPLSTGAAFSCKAVYRVLCGQQASVGMPRVDGFTLRWPGAIVSRGSVTTVNQRCFS